MATEYLNKLLFFDGAKIFNRDTKAISFPFVSEALLAAGIGCVIGLSTIIGAYTHSSAVLPLVLVGAAAFSLIVIQLPEVGILTLLALTNGLVDENWLPVISAGPIEVKLPEIILGMLLGLVFLRVMTHRSPARFFTPVSIPLILFIGAVLLAAANAIFIHNVSISSVLPIVRTILYWLLFFPVVHLICTEAALRRLLTGLWILTAVLAIAAIFHDVFVGLPILSSRTVQLAAAGEQFGDLMRVYSPAERLLYVMLTVAAATLAISKRRYPIWAAYLLVLLLTWLLISYQRNYWLTTCLNLGVLVVLISSVERWQLLKRIMAIVVFLPLLVIAMQVVRPGVFTGEIKAAVERAETLVNNPLQNDENTRWRVIENYYAVPQIEDHLLIGIGIGNPYRPLMEFELKDRLNWFMHNAYLWILVMMGLMGLVPFLLFCGIYVFPVLRRWHTVQDDALRSVYLGFGIAFVGMAVSNIVAPNFLQSNRLSIFPVMIGISEVILHLHAAPQTAAGGRYA